MDQNSDEIATNRARILGTDLKMPQKGVIKIDDYGFYKQETPVKVRNHNRITLSDLNGRQPA